VPRPEGAKNLRVPGWGAELPYTDIENALHQDIEDALNQRGWAGGQGARRLRWIATLHNTRHSV
jgi:hypothetical protein